MQGSLMPAEALTNKKMKELGKIARKAFPSGSNQILLIKEQFQQNTPSLDSYYSGVMAKANLFNDVCGGWFTGIVCQ